MFLTLECPKCLGTGKLTIHVHEHGKPPYPMVLTCIHCDGRGRITPYQAAEIEARDAAWCHCDAPEHGGDHYTHPDIYCCRNCGGVLQTG